MTDAATIVPPARTSAAKIHGDLMAAIRAGRYPPGGQLPNERQIAEAYGCSRQQVRDAMLMLQENGLVRRRVGAGTFLAQNAAQIIERLDAEVDISPKHDHSFLETIEARLVIEPGVAALAARNATEAHRAELVAALEAVREPGTWLEYKSRLYLFARAYYVASGNAFLLRTFDQILKARADHQFDGHREHGAVAEIVRRHSHDSLSPILAAILAGDEAAAEAATRAYIISIAASSGLS